MKTLKYFFIICCITIITTNSAAYPVTYQRFSDGTLIEKPENTSKIVYETTLHFSEQCPTITDDQAKILLDSGSIIINEKLLKGHGRYSSNLLYFTPQYKIERLVITNSNNDVRRTFSVIDGETIVSLWFICGIMSIILFNFSFYLVKKN